MRSELLYLKGFGGVVRQRVEAAFVLRAHADIAARVVSAPWRTADLGPDPAALGLDALRERLQAQGRADDPTRQNLRPTYGDAVQVWGEALWSAEAAARRLADFLERRGRHGRPIAVVAFGLGARVALSALTSPSPSALAGLRRLVLVGSTEPVAALAALPKVLRRSGRVINVCFPGAAASADVPVLDGGPSSSGRLRAAPHAEGVIDVAIPASGVDDLWLGELIVHIASEGAGRWAQ